MLSQTNRISVWSCCRMMGSGNGRRGMKSPPILIAVLLACIFVLTINYWITSSRCAELQKQLAELESRIHRVAAERGAVELKKNEFQDKLERQNKQIDNIQSLHNSQLQSANEACHSEKDTLLDTIAEKEKVMQDLYAQIKSQEQGLSKLKLDYDQLQESQAKKSTFELAQCSYKMKELNEQCEEKLRRASGKGGTVAQEENADTPKNEKPKPILLKDLIQKQDNQENQQVASKETNDTRGAIPNLKQEPAKVSITDDELANKLEGKAKEEEPLKAKEAVAQENKVEETNDEEVEREHLLDIEVPTEDAADKKQAPNPVKQGAEQGRLNDYNGDEGNEAEPEADKQAELADDQNVNENKLEEEKKPEQDNLPLPNLPDAPDLPNAPNLLKLPNAPNPVVPEESKNEDNPLLRK
ncbi:Golgi membrane protein 1 isoform X2 [Xenopus laevis]|uniref:Golgi membrane protein 1 isoform X2 n=1 Tax=Xenopus laevis TaxID=8355 RepID=A0A8J0U1H2_XENLA|nr:Golgi membrane protein 1 isoform X2 [Xenopus laevis]